MNNKTGWLVPPIELARLANADYNQELISLEILEKQFEHTTEADRRAREEHSEARSKSVYAELRALEEPIGIYAAAADLLQENLAKARKAHAKTFEERTHQVEKWAKQKEKVEAAWEYRKNIRKAATAARKEIKAQKARSKSK